jgi:phosphatidylglycerol:prolipoprotein diacylglycerol transferase
MTFEARKRGRAFVISLSVAIFICSPAMHPIFFRLGPLTIRWYGVLVAAGFLVGIWTAARRAKRAGLKSEVIVDLGFIAMVAGIVGARLFYVVAHWEQFATNLVEIVRIDHGGLVFYGGFIAAAVAMVGYGLAKKLPVGAYADVLAPSLPLGHAFGRIGCFLNGCCFGDVCNWPWAVTFPKYSEPFRFSDAFSHQLQHNQITVDAATALPVHPTQLYEAAGLFALAALLAWWVRRKTFERRLMWVYFGLYGVLRFVVEIFRADEPHEIAGLFSVAQILSAGMILVATAGIFWGRSMRSKTQGAVSRSP